MEHFFGRYMIRYFNEDTDFKFKKKKICSQWIISVLSELSQRSPKFFDEEKLIERPNVKVGDINIIFCSDNYILSINQQYLKHNYYTDVITFDYTNNSVLSGDVFISIDTVKANSQEYITDFNEELYRVIIHGILHLYGFKDSTDSQKKIMRELEDFALNCKSVCAL